jgi:hypothetical protein
MSCRATTSPRQLIAVLPLLGGGELQVFDHLREDEIQLRDEDDVRYKHFVTRN